MSIINLKKLLLVLLCIQVTLNLKAVMCPDHTACEEASYLAKICNKVYMIVRRDEFRASKAMQNRVLATPNIEVIFDAETDEILGENKVEGARIKNRKTGEMREIAVSGFFVAIGHQPNTGIFKNYLIIISKKKILI